MDEPISDERLALYADPGFQGDDGTLNDAFMMAAELIKLRANGDDYAGNPVDQHWPEN